MQMNIRYLMLSCLAWLLSSFMFWRYNPEYQVYLLHRLALQPRVRSIPYFFWSCNLEYQVYLLHPLTLQLRVLDLLLISFGVTTPCQVDYCLPLVLQTRGSSLLLTFFGIINYNPVCQVFTSIAIATQWGFSPTWSGSDLYSGRLQYWFFSQFSQVLIESFHNLLALPRDPLCWSIQLCDD